MPSEFPMNDPQNIWKNQPTEPFTMSANELCRKAQQHERKARFEALYSIIAGLMLFVFFAWRFVQPYEVVPRMGVGLLSLWGIYYAYQAYKWIWPGRRTDARRSAAVAPSPVAPDPAVSASRRARLHAPNAGCDAQYHAPVLQKRTREAARPWPAPLAPGGSHVPCLGRGDGYSAGADQVAGHPTAPSEHLAILCPSRDMACSFPSLEEAESGQASTGDRGTACVGDVEPTVSASLACFIFRFVRRPLQGRSFICHSKRRRPKTKRPLTEMSGLLRIFPRLARVATASGAPAAGFSIHDPAGTMQP